MTIKEFYAHILKTVIDHWQTLSIVVVVLFTFHFIYKYTKRAYLINIQDKYIKNLTWKVYEIKFPRENLKTPKAMEQVFASIHGYFSYGFTPWQKWILGKVETWTSFEIVGRKSGTRFFVRFESEIKNIVESAFFSQYPDIELTEVEDYLHDLPHDLPNDKYDVFGSDLLLKQPNCMPIKTYMFFESPDEEQRLDPIATMVEGFSNLKDDETILIQIVIRPTGEKFHVYDHMKEESEHILNKMSGRKPEQAGPGIMSHMMVFVKNLLLSPFYPPTWAGHGEEKQFPVFRVVAPHETDIMKAIGEKMSKVPFEVTVRFITIDKKGNGAAVKLLPNVMSAMAQFNTRNLNQFAPDGATFTLKHKVAYGKWDLFFRANRLERRKRKLWHLYHEREMPVLNHAYHKLGHLRIQSSVMTPDELATIFHPPGVPITARQSMEHVSAKKSGPPAGLPIIE